MKKRLLSALLALALVFVLLPTTALADTTPVTDENVKINGTAVIVGNDISLGEGNGTYSYDKATHTLTLNSATITTTGNIGISFGVPVKGNINYKIELIGTNTISSTSAQAIYVEYDSGLDQQGTQKLSTLTINGSAGSSLILNASGYEKEAIWSKGDFTLSGGTAVTAFSSGKIAVNVGSMTINNSKLSAQSSSYGTTVVLYGLKMIGDTAEFEALNTSSVVSAVLGTSGASENTDWSNYQFTTGSYSGGVLTKSDPEVCSRETLNKYLGLSQKEKSQYIHIAKRTIPALQRTSDVLIAGKNAVVGVETSIPSANGSGTYFYDQASKTLTLNNVTITSGTNAIQFAAAGTYTVKLEGTNKISNVSNGISVTDDKYITSLNVTITGTGSLDISAKGLAINMKKGDLKFENTGAIKLATSSIGLNNNALSVKGNITITDMSKYSVTGTQQTGGKPLGSEVSLTEASQLKGGTTGYRIITITPAAAKPSTIRYNGTTLKQGETIKDGKGGTATVDSKNNTITLKNFNGTALSFDATLADSTLVLEGANTLSSIVTTQKGLTISGSGSLTVGSIKVHNQKASSDDKPNLTITGGAHVTVNRPSSEDKPAVEVSGNLTVTGDGTQLSAECTAATNPAIEVGGNVTISGNPGTNAYTVKAYNKYDTPRGRDDKLRPSRMPSAIEISGDSLSISGSAQVMAKTDSDGAAVWMPAQKVISVVDASLIAQNSSHNFSTISFGDGSDMGNIYAKGQEVNIVAENMLRSDSRLAHRAIKAFIYNHYNTGDSNPYYIKVVSEGVQSGGNVNVIPGHCTSTGGYKVTITRGDAYVAPTKTITEIIVTGLTTPVKGESPVTTGVSLGTGLTVTEVTWGGTFTSDGEFKADESYTAHIKYTVDAGYMLATDAQCQDISAADTVRLNKSESQVEVTFHTAADTTHQHTSETGWQTDGTNHWKICSDCLQRYNEGACTISGYNNDNGASGYHKVLCSVGHVMKTESHDYEYKITQDGTMHYKECKTCHYTTPPVSHNFGSSGTESCECGAIPSHTHNLSGQRGHDDTNHWDICSECSQHVNEALHTYGDWITDTPATDTTDGSKHRTCSVCQYQENATIPKTGTGEIVPPTPDNPGTIVIIRPAEEEKPAQQPNPSTGANDLVGLAVAAAVAAALGSAALLRKHD